MTKSRSSKRRAKPKKHLPQPVEDLRLQLNQLDAWAQSIPNLKRLEAELKNRYLGTRSGSISMVRRRSSVQMGNAARVRGGIVQLRKSQLNPARLTEQECRLQLDVVRTLRSEIDALASDHRFDRWSLDVKELVRKVQGMETKIENFIERLWPRKQ